MLEVEQPAVESEGARIVFNFRALQLEFRFEPPKPLLPTTAAADYRGIEQQLLPSPRCAEPLLDYRHRVRTGGVRLADCHGYFQVVAQRARGEVHIARNQFATLVSRRLRSLVGNLRQRKILGEAARREIFGGASEQREQRAPARFGPRRSACEIRGNPRTIERLLQVRRVANRRMQEHGDLVKWDATSDLRLDSARNLDALLHLARRREKVNRSIERAFRRRRLGEEIALQSKDRRRGAVRRFLRVTRV